MRLSTRDNAEGEIGAPEGGTVLGCDRVEVGPIGLEYWVRDGTVVGYAIGRDEYQADVGGRKAQRWDWGPRGIVAAEIEGCGQSSSMGLKHVSQPEEFYSSP